MIRHVRVLKSIFPLKNFCTFSPSGTHATIDIVWNNDYVKQWRTLVEEMRCNIGYEAMHMQGGHNTTQEMTKEVSCNHAKQMFRRKMRNHRVLTSNSIVTAVCYVQLKLQNQWVIDTWVVNWIQLIGTFFNCSNINIYLRYATIELWYIEIQRLNLSAFHITSSISRMNMAEGSRP